MTATVGGREMVPVATEDAESLSSLRSAPGGRAAAVGDEDDEVFGIPSLLEDFSKIALMVIPATATQLFRVANVSVILIMCGKLSRSDFAGLTLGQSLANIVVSSPGIGFSVMLDTLVTQEYGRDPRSPLMGLYLRRAALVGLAWAAICAVFFFLFAPAICVGMFGDDVGVPASKYLRLGFLASAAQIAQTCVQRFLSAQGIMDVAMWAQLASIFTLIASLWIAVPYGITAVTLAAAIGRATALVICVFFGLRRAGVARTWGVWSLAEVANPAELKAFVRSSIPSVLTTCAERWSFDTLTLLVGLLGALSSGAWAILLNVWIVLFSPSAGYYATASTLVGNAIGAGRPNAARRYARRVFTLQCCTQLGISAVLWWWPELLIAPYANAGDVKAVAVALTPVLAVAVFSDTTNYSMQGMLRGAGDLRFVAAATVFAQWGLSVAVSLALLFQWWSISAVLTGVAFGSAVQLLGLSLRLQHFDWHGCVRQRMAAMMRVEDGATPRSCRSCTSAVPADDNGHPGDA